MLDHGEFFQDFQAGDPVALEGRLRPLFLASRKSARAEARFIQALIFAESQWISVGNGIARWREVQPHSYLASLCHGIWLTGQAWKARGGTTGFEQLSELGRESFLSYAQQARQTFIESLTLEEAPWPSYLWLGLLEDGMGTMDPQNVILHDQYPDWYVRGVELFPSSELLRQRMLASLRPRAGELPDAMLAYLSKAEHDLLEREARLRLRAAYIEEFADITWRQHYDPEKALKEIQRGLAEVGESTRLVVKRLEIICWQRREQEIIPGVDVVLSAAAQEVYGPGQVYWRHALLNLLDHYKYEWSRFADLLEYCRLTGALRSLRILGDAYRWGGYGRTPDWEVAVEWYERASAEGDSFAEYRLFDMFWVGESGPLDRKRAISHLISAAQRREAIACKMVWSLFDKGMLRTLMPRLTLEEAAGFLRRAIRAGSAEACLAAGSAIEQGLLVESESGEFIPGDEKSSPASARRALDWYVRAAEGGLVDAQYQSALMFDDGRAGVVDRAQALHWYAEAAKQGHLASQLAAADCYLWGKGTAKNLNEARRWMSAAADQGDKRAKERLKQLESPGLVRNLRIWLDM